MQTYIALLRGINVSGKRILLMADLRAMLYKMHFQNVKTYIQSGNVVFSSPNISSEKELEILLEEAIFKTFGYEVPVIVRDVENWHKIARTNPFLSTNPAEIDRLYVIFLANEPSSDLIHKINPESFFPDKFELNGKEVYTFYDSKYSNSKLTHALFESKWKVKATARNWKTVQKLAEML